MPQPPLLRLLGLGLAALTLGFAPTLAGAAWIDPPSATAPAAPSEALTPAPSSPSDAETLADRVAHRCRRELEAQRLIGLSVALAHDDGVFHTAHFGFEDRENRIAASDATMYRWASVSKPLTAVLALQLAHDGKLDLDADVRALVPEFPDKGKTITPRLLLTHQGGIVHYSNGPVIPTKRTYDTPHPFESVILALDTFKDSPLVCEPGERHSYSTYGYILLGAAVERAGGKPFAQLARERIIEPLGLTSLQPDYQWTKIEHRAVGYRKRDGAEAADSTNTDVSWKLPGGGFISTVRDMASFGVGMLGERLVDPKTRRTMWTAQKTSAGAKTTYGLGWGVGAAAGVPVYSHSGSQEKTATFLYIMPRVPGAPRQASKGNQPQGVVCAIMCNTEGASLGDLARDLTLLVAQPQAPSDKPTEPAPGR